MWRAAARARTVALWLWPALAAIQASADPYTVLHSFSKSDGQGPDSELVLSGSTLYGTTVSGGGPGRGTVFKINTDGTGFSVLLESSQWGPSSLVLSGSTLYCGSSRGAFKLNTDGTGYADLPAPLNVSGLVLSGQTLYGTSAGNGGGGSVFSVNTDGSGYTVLKTFYGSDGETPCDRVIESEGMLYGTTVGGGAFNYGTVFRLGTNGSSFQLLHSFNSSTDGAAPYAGPLLFDNRLYGLTTDGAYGFYRINPDGTGFTVLKYFSFSDGTGPSARLVASGGRFFGAMGAAYPTGSPDNKGLLFMVNPDGSGYTVIHSFNGDDGANPMAPLLVSGGKLYGVTSGGGTAGYGSVFSFSLAPPVITAGPVIQAGPGEGMVDLSVQADGCPVLAYQWFFNSTNALPGATNSVLHLGPLLPSDSGLYTVVITNAFGAVTSAPALLDVPAGAPTILVQPSNQTVPVGATAQFSVVAGGSPPFGYQWYFNHTNILAGATGWSLSLQQVQANQAGSYTVVVTNSFGAVASSPASLSVVFPTVTNATEEALRAAMAGGGRIILACDGTITLTSTITNVGDTTLDGSGHQVTISGGDSVRVLWVPTNTTLTLVSLTIAHGGNSSGYLWGGQGILNSGGTVSATNCAFSDNNKNAYAQPGGAIWNQSGPLHLVACAFARNLAALPPSVGAVTQVGGGAIWNSGTATVDLCTFTNNQASSPPSQVSTSGTSPGIYALGGAIGNDGQLEIRRSTFIGNVANGGTGASMGGPALPNPGDAGGDGNGGVICNLGTLWLESSTLENNSAMGGGGGTGGDGRPVIDYGTDGYVGGAGGLGAGGGLFNSGTATVVNCTFAGNLGNGGPGGTGGTGGTGILISGGGGPGGAGGAGFGAIYDTSGTLELINCTLASNGAAGGTGGAGGMGGGGVNPGSQGPQGTNGIAAGGIETIGCVLVNTLLATNSGNCSGRVLDGGHNLSSDDTCGFTIAGSLNQTDPKLGPLADNGGPTLTMALLPGSPAIDAADPAGAPVTDQRGIARPVGPAPDIGAFEYGLPPVLRISGSQETGLDIVVSAYPGMAFRLLASSSSLSNWIPIATNQIGTNGILLLHEAWASSGTGQFYRVVMP
jgi:uncharacterized repeat protein (TIGR03803 family)